MKPAKLLLALSAALFICWIGYLVYLVIEHERPVLHVDGSIHMEKQRSVIVSRSQLLVADLVVSAQVPDHEAGADGAVKQVEVLWRRGDKIDPKEIPETLQVANLAQAKGWNGTDTIVAGRYLLPLVRTEDGKSWAIALLPVSPGFPKENGPWPPPRIYPDTPETRRQLQVILHIDAG